MSANEVATPLHITRLIHDVTKLHKVKEMMGGNKTFKFGDEQQQGERDCLHVQQDLYLKEEFTHSLSAGGFVSGVV